jgi:hypothetical protein
MTTKVIEIQNEIKQELSKKAVMDALITTTFKGLAVPQVFLAVQEGMLRGFTFKDFLEKNVYAVPFGSGYSLVTSIDYARKIGMKSGIVGVSAPTFEEKDGKIVSCTITVKRKVSDYIGDYSATVYFDEYNTKRNQWVTKPRTMIAKVAEMHALRKACPEVLSQAYTEDEMTKEAETPAKQELTAELREKVANAKNEAELKAIWNENKGLGKEFAKLVTQQKKFLQGVAKEENENS